MKTNRLIDTDFFIALLAVACIFGLVFAAWTDKPKRDNSDLLIEIEILKARKDQMNSDYKELQSAIYSYNHYLYLTKTSPSLDVEVHLESNRISYEQLKSTYLDSRSRYIDQVKKFRTVRKEVLANTSK